MKINLKLDTGKTKLTKDGYPIVVYVTQNYKERKWRTGHCAKKQEWNARLAMPNNKHPDYYVLLDYLSGLKGKISNVLIESARRRLTLDDVKDRLFSKNYSVFHEAAMNSFDEGYKGTRWSAIRSFDTYYPQATFLEITPKQVEQYIAKMLKKGNGPGGVDSYIRSLRSLWNKLSSEPNPFIGHKLQIPDKVNTVATMEDIKKLQSADLSYRGNIGGAGRYRDYFLLMFYLGGIDPEVLSKLRYDKNVVDGRIVFNRNKGGSLVACNNIIPDQALRILKNYDCAPYLVPIYKARNYDDFRRNFNARFKEVCVKLKLSKKLKPKTPRYTFVDRAQQLLIDERITGQIVGHKFKSTTSLYPNAFPHSVQDEAHLKIVEI